MMVNEIWDLINEVSKATDSHFTLMKFTTHWKAYFGTPDLDTGKGREEVKELMIPSETPEGAIIYAVIELLNRFPQWQSELDDLTLKLIENAKRKINQKG